MLRWLGGKVVRWLGKRFFYLPIYLIYLTIFLFLSVSLYSQQQKTLTVTFLDVGQGDGAVIETPSKKIIIIDAGWFDEESSFDAGRDVVIPYLKKNLIKEIDAIVLSHAHSDHIGGFESVIKKYKIKKVFDSGYAYPSPVYEKLLKLVSLKKIPYEMIRRGDSLDFDRDLEVEVLNPSDDLWDDANNNSLVLKITYKKVSFLFTGDIERKAEEDIVDEYGSDLKSTILKVPHHGSRSSSTEEFLRRVSPQFAVISCGRYNRFGHPHKNVLERYNEFGIKIYRTDTDGSVVISTDGKKVKIKKLGFN